MLDPSDQFVTASSETVERAARLINEGKLVAFPTETVYGLGADATNDTAVAAIFEMKERPTFNPVIIHVADAGQAALIADFNDTARTLANTFWPGPLTLVLPRAAESPVSLLVSAGLETVAVRVPAHPVAQALLRAAGKPIAAPSANKSETVSPTSADHVAQSLGTGPALILDGGHTDVGLESTVLDLTGDVPTILRPGGVTQEELEAAIGPVMVSRDDDPDAPKSPGQMKRHYAPSIPLRLNADAPEMGEAFLTFGPKARRKAALNLSRQGDLREAAANLFAMLRALDQPGIRGIAVMPIPDEGLGRAINDRLKRAATPPERELFRGSCG